MLGGLGLMVLETDVEGKSANLLVVVVVVVGALENP